MLLAIPVVAVAAIALVGLYAIQPDRLTPERAQKALAAEKQLANINQAAKKLKTDNANKSATEEKQSDQDQSQVAENTNQEKPTVTDTKPGEIPDTFKVKFECSNGTFVAEFHKDWSKAGAERVYTLVKDGFFNGARFFRVIKGFMAQFGLAADPSVTAKWKDKGLPEEPVKQSNTRGMISFAMAGGAPQPRMTNKTRTTQLFINFGDNSNLDNMGFAPVGKVVEGMDVVDKIYSGYGEGAPRGAGPNQAMVTKYGNSYLEKNFPKLDYIKTATIEKE